ncbi:MAG: outer membrane protein assembly factor [Bacteroidaceae bacterium]|nr:outer membrane protein assembly factor [Bacteroidaceae bacterium]
MKKTTLLLSAALLAAFPTVSSTAQDTKDEIRKTGWNFGPLPVVGFDSDLGFQYGVCCDIFNYGDGTNYPAYNFKINLEASTYTKGSSVLRSYGDFKNIIPEGKLFYDVAYFSAPKFGFYGFNGFASPYDEDYTLAKPGTVLDDGAKSGYNFMNRRQLRALVSIQKKIAGHLNWAAGYSFYHIETEALNESKFDSYENQVTLYEMYRQYGLIREDEADGGTVMQFRAGLVYDSRDHDSDPTRGLNIEASIEYAPDIVDRDGYNNMGFTFLGSQYIPVVSDKLTLAYRIGVQTKLWGDIPFYFANNINTMFFRRMYTEGLGGTTSVRGINRNGVIGDGLAWVNLEMRWRFYDFKFINQNWGLALNPFFDAGQVIQSYRLDEQKALDRSLGLYSGDSEKPHCAAGLGFKLVMNHNMILSVEASKALSENDGKKLWTNIGFNYMF